MKIIIAYLSLFNCNDRITPVTINSIIHVESKNKIDAVSHKGAIGLMQITPIALEHFNNVNLEDKIKEEDLFNREKNLKVGTWLICWAYKKTDDMEDALMVYNGGYGLFKRVIKKNQEGYLRIYANKVLSEENKMLTKENVKLKEIICMDVKIEDG